MREIEGTEFVISIGYCQIHETVPIDIPECRRHADILRADGDAGNRLERRRSTVIQIDHVRRVEAGDGQVRMTIGVHVLEYQNLEHLAQDKVYKFAYILGVNKIRGTAAGTVLRPIGIV